MLSIFTIIGTLTNGILNHYAVNNLETVPVYNYWYPDKWYTRPLCTTISILILSPTIELKHCADNSLEMVSIKIIGTLTNAILDHCAQQSRF